ncbi:hypothetical protein SELMODRAFT_123043, partial [Selaginella moellendorffii]
QVGNNTLERVAPLSHEVGNVLKRVVVIVFFILVLESFPVIRLMIQVSFFVCLYLGSRITRQTAVGTTMAIAGVAF